MFVTVCLYLWRLSGSENDQPSNIILELHFKVTIPKERMLLSCLVVIIIASSSHLFLTVARINRGFQGVIERWGMSGGPAAHGSTKFHRRIGSLAGGGVRFSRITSSPNNGAGGTFFSFAAKSSSRQANAWCNGQ